VSLYLILKFLHVLLAIIAVGFNASYPIWLTRAQRDPDHALWVLRGPTSPAYARLSQRGTVVGILLAVDVVIIVFLMVTKPTL